MSLVALAEDSYQYDAAGRMVRKEDVSGGVATYVYDGAGQLTSEWISNGYRYTFAYDPLGRRTTDTWLFNNNAYTGTYAYDARGQLSGKTDGGGAVLAYAYDATGNRTSVILDGPSGGVDARFTYAYDELGRTSSVVVPAGQVYTASYDADSRRTTLAMGLGVTRKYQYDSRSLLTTLLYLDGATPLATYIDSYDPAGNRVGRLEGANVLTTWLYDAKYRLLGQERTGQAATYVYDDVDNLLVKHEEGSAPMTFTYDAASRPVSYLQGSGVTTLTWSARGVLSQELKADGGIATYLQSSVRNQLVYAQPSPGTNSSYTYDADGMRLRTLEGAVWATMVWDSGDYLAVNRSGADDSLFVLMDGEALGEILGSEARDFVADPLGSVRGHLDDAADLVASFDYWPYGQSVSPASASDGPLLWLGTLGYYQDPGTGSYIRAREYDQRIGSWIQIDPVWPVEPGFGYVRGAVLTLSDRWGLAPIFPRLSDCKRKGSKLGCYECAYWYFKNHGRMPIASCHAAKKFCGIKGNNEVRCGACGHKPIKSPSDSCMIRDIMAYAEWLNSECGGGADKLAHCWASCRATRCGYGFLCTIRWPFESSLEDIQAEISGRECAGMKGSCIDCCAGMTSDMWMT